jgi:hypothetical protein
MASDTTSSDWGAFSVASANGNLGLGVRGTVYAVRNFTNGDRFLFLLGDLGFGFSLGARVNPIIRNLAKTVLSDKNFDNPGSYTRIKANKSFSASDLNLAPGAEATIGVTATVVGISATTISAWPFFQNQHKPNEEVNEDFFTGAVIYSTNDIGMSVSVAYQFLGRWVKLWSF